jgi:hypothetical protein
LKRASESSASESSRSNDEEQEEDNFLNGDVGDTGLGKKKKEKELIFHDGASLGSMNSTSSSSLATTSVMRLLEQTS